MVYVYICDACKRGEHDKCEKNRDIPPKAKDAENQLIGGGHCICLHDRIYTSPNDVWDAKRDRLKNFR